MASQPRVALLTGAARGIGRAIADALLAEGLTLVAIDRDFAGSDLGKAKNVRTITQDLTELAALPALVESLGTIDVLVNNAGMINALDIDAYTDEARERILTLNLKAPVALIRAIAPQMKARKRGRIVNMASVASFMAHTDLWYGVTKAGVVSFTRSFASYLGPHGIQVNAVAPGPVDTDLLKTVQPARREQLMKLVWTQRETRPDEVAEVVRWLACEAPDTINGAVLDITDGCLLR